MLDDFAYSEFNIIDGLAELLMGVFDFGHKEIFFFLLIAGEIGIIHQLLLINLNQLFLQAKALKLPIEGLQQKLLSFDLTNCTMPCPSVLDTLNIDELK